MPAHAARTSRLGSRPHSPRALRLAIEPRQHAAPPDRHTGESARGLGRHGRRDLDETERLAHLDPPEVTLREPHLAHQPSHHLLPTPPTLLPDPAQPPPSPHPHPFATR